MLPSSVYVYNDRKHKFLRTDLRRMSCPECGLKYGSKSYGEDNFWWDVTEWGQDYLVCACGEQFFTTLEDAEDNE